MNQTDLMVSVTDTKGNRNVPSNKKLNWEYF